MSRTFQRAVAAPRPAVPPALRWSRSPVRRRAQPGARRRRRHARPGRGDRGARAAADRRAARRRHGDRRRGNRARRRAEPRRAAAAAARRRDRPERRAPARVSGVFLRGANRGQTLVLIDGLRVGFVVGGRDVARGDSARPDRAHRDPARTGVEPLRRRRDRRRDPGVHARGGGALAANASAGYGTYDTCEGERGRRGQRGARRASRCRAAASSSAGFNAIVNPANFSYNPDRDGYAAAGRLRDRRAAVGRRGRKLSAQYFRSRLERPVRRRRRDSTTARSRRSRPGRWRAATGSRRSGCRTLDGGRGHATTASRRPRSATSRSRPRSGSTRGRTISRCRRALLTAGSSGARSASTTDAAFAVTSRNTNSVFGVYQLRDGAHALQANLRRDDSIQYGGKTTGAIAYGYRCVAGAARHRRLQHRLQGAVVQRSLLPRLLQSGPGARDLAQRRGGASTGRRRDGEWSTRAPSPTATG